MLHRKDSYMSAYVENLIPRSLNIGLFSKIKPDSRSDNYQTVIKKMMLTAISYSNYKP